MKYYKSFSRKLKIIQDSSDPYFNKAKITSSKDSYEYAKLFYEDDLSIHESVFAMFLNRSNNVIGWVKISQGGTVGSVVDVKIICKYAIDSLSSAVILIHNHPSGNIKPSIQDTEITRSIKAALKLFEITLLDHLIISKSDYYSFSDEGII